MRHPTPQQEGSREFRTFLNTIEANVSASLDVHLIRDNYGTHKRTLIRRWLLKQPRFHLHFTPTSASCLPGGTLVRLADGETATAGDIIRTQALQAPIRTYITHTIEHPKPFMWTKTTDEILASVA